MQKRLISFVIILMLILILVAGMLGLTDRFVPDFTTAVSSNIQSVESQTLIHIEPEPIETIEEIEEEEPKPIRITLSAVGDIMVHSPQIKAAYIKETDSYNFISSFEDISKIIKRADLAICNLETTLAGEDRGYSGYPDFNAPDEMGIAIKEAGFDVVSLANNHAMDKGLSGVVRTLDFLENIGLKTIGSYRSEEEQENVLLVDVNGVSIGLLAYTYGVNAPLSPDRQRLVSFIDSQKINADIQKTKEKGADLVAVSIHWGVEYKREPNSTQVKLAKEMIAAGADIILGTHPHVIQPFEKLEVTLPSGDIREGYVIYSLGNFISNQNMQTLNMKYVDSGVILSFEIEKDPSTEITSVMDITYTPTWVHKFYKDGKYHYRVLIVEDAIKEYEAGNKEDLSENDYNRLKDVLEETREQFKSLES